VIISAIFAIGSPLLLMLVLIHSELKRIGDLIERSQSRDVPQKAV
jgi:hypothetical protein